MHRRLRATNLLALTAALACAAASAVVVACGSDEKAEKAETTAPQPPPALSGNTLRDADLRKAPKGSPERAFLEWWQAIQFQDLGAVKGHTTKSALGTSDRTVNDAVRTLAGLLGKPSVLSKRETGQDAATLRVLIASYAPDRSHPVAELPYSFRLQREGSTWKVADLSYLFDTLRNVRGTRQP